MSATLTIVAAVGVHVCKQVQHRYPQGAEQAHIATVAEVCVETDANLGQLSLYGGFQTPIHLPTNPVRNGLGNGMSLPVMNYDWVS